MYYIKLCTSKRGWQGGRVAKAKVMKEWLGNLPSFFQLLITPLNICHIPAVSEPIMLMPKMFLTFNCKYILVQNQG